MKRAFSAAGAAVMVSCSLLAYGRPAAAATQSAAEVRASALAVSAPVGAVDQGPASGSSIGQLEVVLAPSDPAGLQALVAHLYDPSSPDYHHWLAPEEFADRFGPSAATVAAAKAWLSGKGLHPSRSSTFAVAVRASTAELGKATGTSFHRYRTADGATGVVAQGAPLVPASLRPAVSAIYGLSTLPEFTSSHRVAQPATATGRPGVASPSAPASQGCSAARSIAQTYGAYTMDQLSSEYGIAGLRSAGLTGAGQTVGVYELSPYSSSDVAAYESCFALGNNVSRVTVDGGASDPSGTPEADLDIEQIATQAPGAKIVSYEAPNSNQGWYDLWSNIVNGDQAQVVSTSWGMCEADAWQSAQTSASTSVLFAQAASQGQTVTAASGDSGSEDCAQNYPNGAWSSLGVDYPASDPNVIAVGGTYYNGPGNESVWNDCAGSTNPTTCASNDHFQAAGGGGESTHEPRPSWQPGASGAPGYVCSGQACREVPDISANAGVPMVDYANGGWGAGEGTSYAAPLVAGLVADRNQGCSGRPGNFAPLLYGAAASSAAASLLDVTQGSNDMLGSQSGSYRAGSGYDLASGLGTPVGAGLACPDVVSVTQNASPGATVTVSGVGLENAQILFGNVPAVVQSETVTSATVVVPAGSGTVTVSATSANGTGSKTAQFAYPSGTTSGAGTGTSGGTAPTSPTTTGTGTSPTTTGTSTSPTTTGTSTSPTTTGTGATGGGATGTGTGTTGGTTTSAGLPPASGGTACPGTGGAPLPGAAGIAAVDINGCDGYFVVDPGGQVSAFGAATPHGDLAGYHLAAPIIAIDATPDGNGYWLLGADGGVFTFGDAHFYGSTGGIRLHAPVVGMAVTPDNRGYWMVAQDGGVFSFGDARFYGSTGNLHLAAPVDGIAVAPGGNGYWLVGSDGGVFTFTRDGFFGSLGRVHLAKPIVGMSSTPDGRGYTLVGSDGGVFTFGDAPFYGSLGGHAPASPVVDLSAAPANDGYYLVTAAGAVYSFGPGTQYFGGV